MKGADSSARFSAALARSAGYDIGGRYLRPAANGGVTTAEVDDYRAHGLILLPILEFDGKPDGYADGVAQGQAANYWLGQLGLNGYGCAFTDDVSGYPYAKVSDTMRGVRSVFRNHVVYYGPSHFGDQLVADGLADSVWIEGAWSYSPGYNPHNPVAPTAVHECGTQYPAQFSVGGVTVDFNTFSRCPWLPGAGPTPPPGGNDMSYSNWTSEEQWAEAVSNANLVIGVDTPPNADGKYEGQRPPAQFTTSAISARQAHHEQLFAALLKKAGVAFHWDSGTVVLDNPDDIQP